MGLPSIVFTTIPLTAEFLDKIIVQLAFSIFERNSRRQKMSTESIGGHLCCQIETLAFCPARGQLDHLDTRPMSNPVPIVKFCNQSADWRPA
jgi:hypothetical protein